MLIKMTTSIAGLDWSAAPGDVVDRPEAEAKRFVAAGFADPAEPGPEQPKPEKPKRSRRGKK